MVFLRIILVIFSLLVGNVKCDAQENLVVDGSFEDITWDCSVPYFSLFSFLNKWRNPNTASPDYYNSCINPNHGGTVNPRTGKAYVGIYTFENATNNLRDYVQGYLKEPLIKNSKYCIEFYVSLKEGMLYSNSNIGVFFSEDTFKINNWYNISVLPQIENTDSNPLTKMKIWQKIEGCFISKGGESVITIGNFRDDSLSQLDTATINYTQKDSYYYIDDVLLFLNNDTLPPPIPKDTAYINLPNAFSPNGDGENDVFRVLGSQYVQSIELAVYNRWGQQVFYTNQKEQGWDGTFKGQKAPTGVYAYTLQATLPNGKLIHKKGNVTLKR